jgi:3-dehydroquinate dehydratase-2
MLGVRQPEIYGHEILADIETACRTRGSELGLEIDFRQSTVEGELVTWIQEARERVGGIVINAAAYTHTSIALLDALNLIEAPIIEVHLSNIYARDAFRHHSYVSPVATGVICGLGSIGYLLALDAIDKIRAKNGNRSE